MPAAGPVHSRVVVRAEKQDARAAVDEAVGKRLAAENRVDRAGVRVRGRITALPSALFACVPMPKISEPVAVAAPVAGIEGIVMTTPLLSARTCATGCGTCRVSASESVGSRSTGNCSRGRGSRTARRLRRNPAGRTRRRAGRWRRMSERCSRAGRCSSSCRDRRRTPDRRSPGSASSGSLAGDLHVGDLDRPPAEAVDELRAFDERIAARVDLLAAARAPARAPTR